MICPKCKNEVPDGLLFCPECGTRVAINIGFCSDSPSKKKSFPVGKAFPVKLTFAIAESLLCLTMFFLVVFSDYDDIIHIYKFFDAVFHGLAIPILIFLAFLIMFIALGINHYLAFSKTKRNTLHLIAKIASIPMALFLFLVEHIEECIGYRDVYVSFLIISFVFLAVLIADLVFYFRFKNTLKQSNINSNSTCL